MRVAELINNKGEVITVLPEQSIMAAMEKLVENKIGSLVVCDNQNNIAGIISERDVLRSVFEDYENLKSKTVADLMTKNLLVAIPEDDIDYIMGIMTQNRIRHVPVVNKEGLIGIISIGDIVKFQLQEIKVKNRYLEEYMLG